MKSASQVMPGAVSAGVKTPVSSEQLSQEQRNAVGYFFARLKMVSSQQYDSLMPDSKTESLVKREYAPYLIQFTRGQIDAGLDAFHRMRQAGDTEYKFLDIDSVIGLIRSGGSKPGDQPIAGLYKVFPRSHQIEDLTTQKKRKEAGESELAKLRGMFD